MTTGREGRGGWRLHTRLPLAPVLVRRERRFLKLRDRESTPVRSAIMRAASPWRLARPHERKVPAYRS